MDDDDLERIASVRHTVHVSNRTRRFRADPMHEDRIGVAGELHFATLIGHRVDDAALELGDAGYDFDVCCRLTIDVKTYLKPYRLLVKVTEIDNGADVYVLQSFDAETKLVASIGWETRAAMRACPTKDFGYGIVSHYKLAAELRPMALLLARIRR